MDPQPQRTDHRVTVDLVLIGQDLPRYNNHFCLCCIYTVVLFDHSISMPFWPKTQPKSWRFTIPMWLKSPEFHKAVVERLIAELYRGRRCVGQVWLIFRNRTPWERQRKRTDRSDIYRNCLGKQRCVQKQLVLAYIDTILIVKGIVHQKKKKKGNLVTITHPHVIPHLSDFFLLWNIQLE